MMWIMTLALVLMAPQLLWAEAALKVEQVAGKTLVRATAAKLAAWRPTSSGLVVVIPASSGSVEIGSLADGVQAESFSDNGLNGVLVHGVTESWQVVQQGANWIIRPGPSNTPDSVLMLRDGWRVDGDVVIPQTLTVLGKRWQVGLIGSAKSVAGSVAGVVRLAESAPTVAALPETPDATPVSTPAVQAAAPVAKIPELKPVVHSEEPKLVKIEAAPGLRPVAQPAMAMAALPSNLPVQKIGKSNGLKAVSINDMLARIEPAAGEVSTPALNLPTGLAMVKAQVSAPVVSLTLPSGGLTKVSLHPAAPMRGIGVGGNMASEILPQILGDIYLPGTLISLTVPADDLHSENLGKPAAVSAAEILAEASPTLPPSNTWNQTTLEPVAKAMEAQKASATTPIAEVSKPEIEPDKPVAMLNRILPVREGQYIDAMSDAMQTVAEAPADSPRARDGELNLAAMFLTWQRPEEALAVLDGLPVRADKLPANPQARLYMALAKLAEGGQPDAGLFDQGGQLAAHARLWKAVAASHDGDYATALKLWPQERGVLPQYPPYLREMAQEAQATALVMVGDRAVATKVVDSLVDGYDSSSTVPVALKRLGGLVRLGTPEESRGLELLASAAEDMRDPAQAYRAKYEFVRALQQRHDLSDEQVRTYLTDLWFDWRGDDLERDVLSTLADLYDKANEPREALQYWQTLVRAYPKAPDMSRIAERMTDAFLKVFDPENPKIYDALSYIGLYYDFSELVPNDGRGDAVQEQVARLLVQANLWNRAIPILEQQLNTRPLDALAQGRLSLLLAEAYGNTGRAGDGIKIIDKWQHAATTAVLQHQWKILEAELLLKLNRPESATRALVNTAVDDPELRDQRIEAAWMARDWSNTIPLINAKLKNVTAAQLVSDTGAQLAVFRLAYAYGQTEDAPDLDALTKRYATGIEKLPDLADGMGAVAAGTGISASIVAAGPLAPITGELSGLNRMADRIQGIRETLTAERKQQQEYNDKMRYMDLLPPPAL